MSYQGKDRAHTEEKPGIKMTLPRLPFIEQNWSQEGWFLMIKSIIIRLNNGNLKFLHYTSLPRLEMYMHECIILDYL